MPPVKREFRRFRNAATALSALLCLGSAGLWLVTLAADPLSAWNLPAGPLGIRSAGGEVELAWWAGDRWMSSWVFPLPNRIPKLADGCPWRWFGFGAGAPGPFDNRYRVVVPHWFIVLTTALLPVRWTVVRSRARRAFRNCRCGRCGYDLRATPDRCPECGTLAKA
jgi:hypothetical protein